MADIAVLTRNYTTHLEPMLEKGESVTFYYPEKTPGSAGETVAV